MREFIYFLFFPSDYLMRMEIIFFFVIEVRDKIIGESYIISQNMKEKEKKINPIIPHLFERKKKTKIPIYFLKPFF